MRSSFINQKRSFLVGLGLLGSFVCILSRLAWIQVINAEASLAVFPRDWLVDTKLKPRRGTIYDRRQQVLAVDRDAYYFVADPQRIEDPVHTAKVLAPVLEIEEATLLRLLKQDKRAVELRDKSKRVFSPEIRDEFVQLVRSGKIQGVFAYPTTKREYPTKLATHALGFLNREGVPVTGVEKYYEKDLHGEEGEVKYARTKDGIMVDEPDQYQKSVDGHDLVLTIDARIQRMAEEELSKAVKNSKAKSGVVIISEVGTGDILALANLPTFNNNKASEEYTAATAKNIAVESNLEPGSTFKIIPLAAAIEKGIFSAQQTFESGSIQVADRTIHDWKPEGWGRITYGQGVELSSNVAFVNLAEQLGVEGLTKYIKLFGFGDITAGMGERTGIDLPNEGRGIYFNRPMTDVDRATVSFGQSISVTPTQQLAAVAAIANHGVWVQPHVLKERVDGDQTEAFVPKTHRAIKPETADEVSRHLRNVVLNGTGKEADIKEIEVAGKTGTAQKPKENGPGYKENKYIISFAGFAPVSNPKFVLYVALDEPDGEDTGRAVIATRLASIIFRHLAALKNDISRKS